MSGNYYNRTPGQNADGTPLFAADLDIQNEVEAIAVIEKKWTCTLHRFGLLCPVDFYATRHNRLVGVIELKSRHHPASRFPTVFLNLRKWFALTLAQNGLGVPAIFLAKWTDCIRYVPVDEVDARRVSIAGCARRVKSSTDIEPCIEVPVESMKLLANLQ